MSTPLPIVNLATARFECTYGRGCDGLCCRAGEPPVPPDEAARLRENRPRILPLLRPEARTLIEAEGILAGTHPTTGQPQLRVAGDWCIFFHNGCVLHKLGAAEGNPFRYKPSACALFPLSKNDHGQWYVRQWGYEDEIWDLFCLNPARPAPLATDSLQTEIALAHSFDHSPQIPPGNP